MGDADNPAFVAAHVQYVRTRSRAESDQLAGLMLRWAWPGGHDDRYEPVAIEWVRRWVPERAGAGAPECGCTAGRCTVCN